MPTEQDDAADSGEIEALRDLLQHPGWAVFLAHARSEWGGEGYGRRMKVAIASVPPGPERAYALADAAERIDRAESEINALLTWPRERVAALSIDAKPRRRPFDALRRMGG